MPALSQAPEDQPHRLLSPKATAERTSTSFRTIQRWVREETFPQPVRISAGRIGFYEGEVNSWLSALPRVKQAA
jgi:predicted DNA-binding transcriptional regulator AlpA